MERSSQRGPRYVGHRLAVPELGDYHTLPQEREGRALVHTPKGVELISNVCRHRQALILQGRGSLEAPGTRRQHRLPAAPLDLRAADARTTGTLIGAPHFAQDPCLNLHNYPLHGVERPAVRGQRPRRRSRPGPHGPARRPRLRGLRARPRRAARVQLQLEDLHRGLPRGLPRRPLPPRPGQLRHLRRPALGVRAATTRCRPWAWPTGSAAPAARSTRSWQEQLLQVPRRQAARVRRDLADLLPARHGRVVPARAHRLDAAPDRPAARR